MRWLVFILGLVLSLILFGVQILVCFMVILGIVFDIDVDTAMTLGVFLTVAMVVGIGIKVCFIDDE
jgi:hypothetical protein